MKHDNRTDKRKLGDIGENIACSFLEKRGFAIVDRNYLRKWGEIDIIAKKRGIIHFVEVKTVARPTEQSFGRAHVTNGYRPEENMHPWKLRRLSRTMQTYLLEKKVDTDWQLDLITVKLDTEKRLGHVEIIENIVI